jgi:hypothetical protein
MDPSLDSVEIQTLDCDVEETTISLLECISSYQYVEPSSPIITMNDINPPTNWKLPAIMPKEIYKMQWWNYKSHTQIKMSFVDVSFTDQDEPIHINLLDKSQIGWDIRQGYKYAHLSVVKVGLGPLVRPFLHVASLCDVVDTHHVEFSDAIIGGFLGLEDPHIYNFPKILCKP